jgi:UDP-glucose 4-epimerase
VTAALVWVVGRGGLLGRHVDAALVDAGADVWPGRDIRWGDPAASVADLEVGLHGFLDAAADRPWRLLWCAGAGVVATSAASLARETTVVERLLSTLTRRLQDDRPLADRGTLFFSSSAGALYAASTAQPPFDEFSPVAALAPYGREKLAQEALFRDAVANADVDVVVGRFSNLYGLGQDLTKPQGLVSHVGRAALRHQPISIYVPLDTIRDYLFATDAGRMVAAALDRRADERRDGAAPAVTTKIFASEQETTVAAVLAAWRQALHRPLRVALASDPVAALQPRMLSFRSRVWPDLLGRPTRLTLGVDALRREQLARLMQSASDRVGATAP